MWRGARAAWAAALLAAAAVFAVRSTPVSLEPRTPVWDRVAHGAPGGVVSDRAVVVIPGVDRSSARRVRLVMAGGSPASVGVSVDNASLMPARVPAEGLVLVASPAAAPGLRLDVGRLDGSASIEIRGIWIDAEPPLGAAAVAFALAGAVAFGLRRRLEPELAGSLSLFAASALACASVPAILLLKLPAPGAALRAAVVLVPAALSLLAGPRRGFAKGALVVAGFVFGAWVRAYFLPSTGSWDTDYWKAWTTRARTHGVTQVYGGRESVPAGHALAQARGDEELFLVEWSGKSFVVDQPPGAMFLWRSAYALMSALRPRLGALETENVAAKLPALLGDLVAVAVLLAIHGGGWVGIRSACLYWAFPVSWLSGSVFGFFDNAYAAPLLLAVALAGRGRALPAGVVFALAGLVKATGLIVAPALVVALLAARASVLRAVLAGLVVIALAMIPFALSGTLTTAVIHVYRIVFQERLSGGFANPWWLVGHLLDHEPGGLGGAVRYARLGVLPLPARPLATALFGLAVAYILRFQWKRRGQGPALLAAGAIAYAYGILAIGVQVNHPHAFFLLLVATSLASWRHQLVCLGAGASYALNMVLLEALGRLHGSRYSLIEPLNLWLASWRLTLGFDATLLLVPINVGLFALLLVSLRDEMRALEDA